MLTRDAFVVPYNASAWLLDGIFCCAINGSIIEVAELRQADLHLKVRAFFGS